MLERIRTKPGYKYLAILFLLIAIFYLINKEHNSYIEKLQHSTITCNIKGKGWTVIDSSKIVDFDDETGIIIFENGYAKNCIIKEK